MSYKQALEAAGAEIHDFKYFGDYQGTWWANVTYQGHTGFIAGYYGSCSGCDSYEGTFNYDEMWCDLHKYERVSERSTCEDCQESETKYEKKLAEFGRQFLDNIMTKEEAMSASNRYCEEDLESEECIWIRNS